MIGLYLVVQFKVCTCTWYTVMGLEIYNFAPTLGAHRRGRVLHLPRKPTQEKGLVHAPIIQAFSLFH